MKNFSSVRLWDTESSITEPRIAARISYLGRRKSGFEKSKKYLARTVLTILSRLNLDIEKLKSTLKLIHEVNLI
ncbi:hypothetical protein A2933_00960 [Candidatus Nomurabacteria bacterium RIFCSPLOWO2_01_FULL_46_18]|uniref:Transposase DDE domain-containing protein n=1 Tax=Candidatus Nomurabacteria bacterium RIFCSPLOWO2_01_FULL_46_18 TaxID=1801783 RepID=A0A1F6XE76_9BACT|nr:MAG: hypothetical protein A2933_00960 [Candidatus Nomurabacteria bacterium RIFCSPLOWO2_01_FULL_46_18]